jgi:hypothetical protein
MVAIFRKAFNSSDIAACNIAQRGNAGALGDAINMNRTGPTKTNTASKLCAFKVQFIAHGPQQWRVLWHI